MDRDILEVEQRIARRRTAVELTGRAVWRRTVTRVISPAGILGAAVLGAVTVVGMFRRPRHVTEKRRKAGMWGSFAGLAASLGFALLKAQYGSPLNMANTLLAKAHAFKQRKQQHSVAR